MCVGGVGACVHNARACVCANVCKVNVCVCVCVRACVHEGTLQKSGHFFMHDPKCLPDQQLI